MIFLKDSAAVAYTLLVYSFGTFLAVAAWVVIIAFVNGLTRGASKSRSKNENKG